MSVDLKPMFKSTYNSPDLAKLRQKLGIKLLKVSVKINKNSRKYTEALILSSTENGPAQMSPDPQYLS